MGADRLAEHRIRATCSYFFWIVLDSQCRPQSDLQQENASAAAFQKIESKIADGPHTSSKTHRARDEDFVIAMQERTGRS